MNEPTIRVVHRPVKYERLFPPLHNCDGMGGIRIDRDGVTTIESRECSVCAPVARENLRRQMAAMGVGKL